MKEKEEKRRTTVFLPRHVFRDIKVVSAYKDCRVNDCIVEALEQYIKENLGKIRK